MADLSLVTDKYFTIASETFTDNLSSSIAAGAATVPVLNNSEYANGDDVVLTVDPGTVNEATFIGRKSGLNFVNCVWTEGNLAVGHSNGATVIDYDSATHHSAQSKGILQFANSNGTLKTQPVRDALGLGATAANGWEVSPYTYAVSSGYNKGNREFDLTVASNDLTSIYSAGQRLRFTRGTVPATQSALLASASSQNFSRASGSLTGTLSTVTDDITAEIWVKPTTIGVVQGLITRYNGTSGFLFYIETDGRISIEGHNGGGGNYRKVQSNQSIWTQDWVHVAASLDMSGWTTATNAVWLNGISVPVTLISAGTNPTAFIQAGNLEVGSLQAANFANGAISDARMWNVVRTTTQIRDNMYQQLTGSETNLIGYWKLANSVNDSTSSLNHLTASGGATTTNTDNPFGAIEYAIIVKVAYGAPNTTITCICPIGGSIPNQTLTAPYYSAQRTPFNFPGAKMDWQVKMFQIAGVNKSTAVGTVENLASQVIAVPTGKWLLSLQGEVGVVASAGNMGGFMALSTSSSSYSDLTAKTMNDASSLTQLLTSLAIINLPVRNTAQTNYYCVSSVLVATGAPVLYNHNDVPGIVIAESAYV